MNMVWSCGLQELASIDVHSAAMIARGSTVIANRAVRASRGKDMHELSHKIHEDIYCAFEQMNI